MRCVYIYIYDNFYRFILSSKEIRTNACTKFRGLCFFFSKFFAQKYLSTYRYIPRKIISNSADFIKPYN